MRILIVTTQDRFFLTHIKERASYFVGKGCIVAVAAQKTSDSLVKEITDLGFCFYDTKIERKSINPISQILGLIRLSKIQLDFKPDVSYHLGAKAIFYGTLSARIVNSKVGVVNAPIGLGYIFSSQTFLAKILRPIVLTGYKIFLNPQRSRVIIENVDDINFFVKKKYLKLEDAFCVLGAGVDTNQFTPMTHATNDPVCTVVMASRLIREKGVFDFVEVATKLHQMNVPVKMQLVGEPDYGNPSSLTKEEYEEILTNPAVECLGYQTNMVPILQKAQICCLPSFYREGLPRILVEATSSGLAILTTDTVGCREVIRDQNGFLFKPHDVEKLYSQICYLISHKEELRGMCSRSRQVALDYFETKKICQRTYEIICTLNTKTI